MAAPLSTARNKYHENIKGNAIFTPDELSRNLFDILLSDTDRQFHDLIILDPAVGEGNLLWPYKDFGYNNYTIGFDIKDFPDRNFTDMFLHQSFLEFNKGELFMPDIIVMNPPFNTDPENRDWMKENKKGKALLPELFLDHIFELWGHLTPVVMITPMGFRLNQRSFSGRRDKYKQSIAKITSIASLPLDTFPGVEFHAEVLFWNIAGLKPHYWL